jgi:hypothetical protein
MAVDTRIANALAITCCDAIVDSLDAGAGAGLLRIYDGTIPTDVDTAVGAQTLLAELTLSDPAFGAAADVAGVGARATANAITGDTSANATGTASWFRAVDSSGNAKIDGTVGTSSADLVLGSVAIQSGVAVNVTSWTFTVPEK